MSDFSISVDKLCGATNDPAADFVTLMFRRLADSGGGPAGIPDHIVTREEAMAFLNTAENMLYTDQIEPLYNNPNRHTLVSHKENNAIEYAMQDLYVNQSCGFDKKNGILTKGEALAILELNLHRLNAMPNYGPHSEEQKRANIKDLQHTKNLMKLKVKPGGADHNQILVSLMPHDPVIKDSNDPKVKKATFAEDYIGFDADTKDYGATAPYKIIARESGPDGRTEKLMISTHGSPGKLTIEYPAPGRSDTITCDLATYAAEIAPAVNKELVFSACKLAPNPESDPETLALLERLKPVAKANGIKIRITTESITYNVIKNKETGEIVDAQSTNSGKMITVAPDGSITWDTPANSK